MAYHIEVYPETAEQVRALPAKALRELGQVFEVLDANPMEWRSLQPREPGRVDADLDLR